MVNSELHKCKTGITSSKIKLFKFNKDFITMLKRNLDNQYNKWQRKIDKRHFNVRVGQDSYEEKLIFDDRIKHCQEVLEVAISNARNFKSSDNKVEIEGLNIIMEELGMLQDELNLKLEQFHGCLSKHETSHNNFYDSYDEDSSDSDSDPDEDSSDSDSDTDEDERQGFNFNNYNVSEKSIQT